jgi:hypothetical protein
VVALCDVVLALGNESYAQGVLSLEASVEGAEGARRECNDNLLDGMARVIVGRMFINDVLSRKFDAERLVEHVKARISSKAEEWIAGFPKETLGNDSSFRPVWGLKVRHRRTSEEGRALAFEDECVVVEWSGPPVRKELCLIEDIECV